MNFAKALSLSLVLAVMAIGCTVAPPLVDVNSTSYTENDQNGGIICRVFDQKTHKFTGFLCTLDYYQRYKRDLAVYGARLEPPLTDPTRGITTWQDKYVFTKQAMDARWQMSKIINQTRGAAK